jgi:DNA (cytosine-5)-methyltransferase 1
MRSIELFSGAGGLALGLESAGFKSVALIERNKDACATLRLNRPKWNVVESDIQTLNFHEFTGIDLVAGGPPCQPFSMGGKANGNTDQRDMFPEAVRCVREVKPKAFVFENVRGLLRAAFQNYVEFIRLQLSYPEFPISRNVSWEKNFQRIQRHHTATGNKGLEYKVTVNLTDAADYGIPQRRHRVFFVGIRNDHAAGWFFPEADHSQDELLKAQYVTSTYWKEHDLRVPSNAPERFSRRLAKLRADYLLPPTGARWQTVRDAIADLGDPRHSRTLADHVYQAGARAYPGHTGSPLDEPSKALKAGDHGVPGGENMMRHANGSVRYFTVRESARIQTFPDDWRFSGSWTESMRQLGNAVPVQLAATVARSVADFITRNERRKSIQSAR